MEFPRQNRPRMPTTSRRSLRVMQAFPGRSRPLCAYPQHVHYKGTGNADDAASFECVAP